jgi:RND family efflux transporter MFP subunit
MIKYMINKYRKQVAILMTLVLLFSLTACSNKDTDKEVIETIKPKIQVMTVSKQSETVMMEITGTIKPLKSVVIKALTGGTVTNILAEQGDELLIGQSLAYLFDARTETNYSSALNSYNTALNSYNSSLISAEETLTQAKLALEQAQESLQLAESTHTDTIESTTKSLNDTLNNSIISNEGYLNNVYNTLDFADGILGVDHQVIYSGLENVFSARNFSYKNQAKSSYQRLKNDYEEIYNQEINKNNIEEVLSETIMLLGDSKSLIDTILLGMYSTIISSDFNQTSLSTLTNSTISYQNTVSTNLSYANTTLQGIESIRLVNRGLLDQINSALRLSQIGLTSAETALANANQGKILAISGAENSLQSAQTNLDLVGISKSRQNIIAPFTGVISNKMVEIGDEVNAGQGLFEISVVNHVKIETSIPAENVSFLTLGDEVMINNIFPGTLSKINPIADPVSKKVTIEIGYNNSNLDLIPESFADVQIPLSKLAEQENIYIIPLKAVDLEQDTATVKIIEDNKIVNRIVEYLQIINDKIVISNGLEEGEQIAIENAKLLNEGTEVEISDY